MNIIYIINFLILRVNKLLVFFARLLHSTSKFDKIILSKCVTHDAFRHDVVSPSGNAFPGKSLDPRLDL